MLCLKKIFMAALLVSAVGQLLCFTQAKAVDATFKSEVQHLLNFVETPQEA